MKTKLNSIQVLRGVAALLVVHAHTIDRIQLFGISSRQSHFHYLENFGAIGVDLFFVISGFIMAYITGTEATNNAKEFLCRRFIRVYPLYFLITLLCYLSALPTLPVFLKDLTILPVFDTKEFIPATIPITWTLAFEFFFYGIMALCIAMVPRQRIFLSFFIIGVLSIAGIVFKPLQVQLHFITNPICLEFVLGIGIAALYLQKNRIPVTVAASALVMGLVCYGCLIYFGFDRISENEHIFRGTLNIKRVILWGLPSALLVFGVVFLEQRQMFQRIFSNKIAVSLGNASFSIYLLHLWVFLRISNERFPFMKKINGDLLIIILIFIAAVAGMVVYRFIEKPLLAWLHQKWTKRKNSAAIPLSSQPL